MKEIFLEDGDIVGLGFGAGLGASKLTKPFTNKPVNADFNITDVSFKGSEH